MKKINVIFAALALFAIASNVQLHAKTSACSSLEQTIREAIADLLEDNAIFAEKTSREHFDSFLDIQNPRVTMVMCSDSRVQTDNFSQGAENDIFIARNIGNQFST